jgi:magnesium-transporting ATPase (P-type)
VCLLLRAELEFSSEHHQHGHKKNAIAGLVQGSATISIISAYRDGVWQRLPKLLLVQGDIIALMAGDASPGTVAAVFKRYISSTISESQLCLPRAST